MQDCHIGTSCRTLTAVSGGGVSRATTKSALSAKQAVAERNTSIARASAVSNCQSLRKPDCWGALTTLCARSYYATRLDKPYNRIETHTLPIMSRPLLGQARERPVENSTSVKVPDSCQNENLED